jgi:hypothetical protein
MKKPTSGDGSEVVTPLGVDDLASVDGGDGGDAGDSEVTATELTHRKGVPAPSSIYDVWG